MQAELNVPTTSTLFVTLPKHCCDAVASKLIEQDAPAARSNGPNVIVWPVGVTEPPQLFETFPAYVSSAGRTSVATTERPTVPVFVMLIEKRVVPPGQIELGTADFVTSMPGV